MIVNFQIEIPQKDGQSIIFERRNEAFRPPQLPTADPPRADTSQSIPKPPADSQTGGLGLAAAAQPGKSQGAESDTAQSPAAQEPLKKIQVQEPTNHIDVYYDVLAHVAKKFDILAQDNALFVRAYNSLAKMNEEPAKRDPAPPDRQLAIEMEIVRHRKAEFETELRNHERALTEQVLQLEVAYEESRFGLKRLEKADIEKSERYLGLLEEIRLKKAELADLRERSGEQSDLIVRLRDEKVQSERYANQILAQKATLIQQSLEKEKENEALAALIEKKKKYKENLTA